MSQPYVIKILVPSGDPAGVRVVEKSNWSGQVVVFARSDLALAASERLDSPGVYILRGEDPDEAFDSVVYVGQSDNVARRLTQHVRSDDKEFWTETVAFVSKDSALNKAHGSLLEAKLIELANAAGRVKVMNRTQPPSPSLSAADLVEAEGFLAEALAILPLVGVVAFEKPSPRAHVSNRLFLSGPEADGKGEIRSDGFLVLAGSTARTEAVDSLGTGWAKLRGHLVETGVFVEEGSSCRLSQDYLFKSISAASSILLGRQSNGWLEWKNTDGVTMKDLQAQEIDANTETAGS